MCRIHREPGALNDVRAALAAQQIDGFDRLEEMIAFQSRYPELRQSILQESENTLKKEHRELKAGVAELADLIRKRRSETASQLRQQIEALESTYASFELHGNQPFWNRLLMRWKAYRLRKAIQRRKDRFESDTENAIAHLLTEQESKNQRLQLLETDFELAMQQHSAVALRDAAHKKQALDELNTLIYGAIGEQKVAQTLQLLPEPSFLINNFRLFFRTPLYYKEDGSHILTVQIDHLLVTSAGIFIIETKNWSEASMENLNMRSPVAQIRRAGYALYRLFRFEGVEEKIGLTGHHWGEIQLPVRNLLVFINQKPDVSFPFVKVLTLRELNGYVQYFKPVFSPADTERIAAFMLKICDQKL
jgi:hypothetical protein